VFCVCPGKKNKVGGGERVGVGCDGLTGWVWPGRGELSGCAVGLSDRDGVEVVFRICFFVVGGAHWFFVCN